MKNFHLLFTFESKRSVSPSELARVGALAWGKFTKFFDTFDGAKPRFLNQAKKRRSVSTLSIPRASDRAVEWVDFWVFEG